MAGDEQNLLLRERRRDRIGLGVALGFWAAGFYALASFPPVKDVAGPNMPSLLAENYTAKEGVQTYRVTNKEIVEYADSSGTKRLICPAKKLLAVSSSGTLVYETNDGVCKLKNGDVISVSLGADVLAARFSEGDRYCAVIKSIEGKKSLGIFATTSGEEVWKGDCLDVGPWDGETLPYIVEREGGTSLRKIVAAQTTDKEILRLPGTWHSPCTTGNEYIVRNGQEIAIISEETGSILKVASAGRTGTARVAPDRHHLAQTVQEGANERLVVLDARDASELIVANGNSTYHYRWSPSSRELAYQPVPREWSSSLKGLLSQAASLDVLVYDDTSHSSRLAIQNSDGADVLVDWNDKGLLCYSDVGSSVRFLGMSPTNVGDSISYPYGTELRSRWENQLKAAAWPIGLGGLLFVLPFVPGIIYNLRRRRRTERPGTDGKKGLFDIVCEHPIISTVTLATGCSWLVDRAFGQVVSTLVLACREDTKLPLLTGLGLLAAGPFSIVYGQLCSYRDFRPPRARVVSRLFRDMPLLLMGKATKPESLELYLSQVKFETRDAAIMQGTLHVRRREFDYAALSLKEALSRQSEHSVIYRPLDVVRGAINVLATTMMTPRFRKVCSQGTLEEMLDHQFALLAHNQVERVATLGERFMALPEVVNDPALGILEGMILRAAGIDGQADEITKRCIALAIENGIPLQQVGEYSVYRMGGGEFLKSTVLLKTSKDAKWLRAEARLTEEAGDLLRQHGLHASRLLLPPFALGEATVLPLYYESGPNLISSDDIHAYGRAALALGLLHGRFDASSAVVERNSISGERRASLPIQSPVIEDIERAADAANALFKPVFKKDPHGENWILAKGKIVAIDFEPRGYTTPPHELAKLVMQRGPWPSGTLLDVLGSCIEGYVRGREKTPRPLSKEERQHLLPAIAASAPLRAVSFMAAMHARYSRDKVKRGFLRNANELLCVNPSVERRSTGAYLSSLESALA